MQRLIIFFFVLLSKVETMRKMFIDSGSFLFHFCEPFISAICVVVNGRDYYTSTDRQNKQQA